MPLPSDLTNLDETKPDGSVIPVAQLDDYQREHRGYTKGWAAIEHDYNGRHAFGVGGTVARPTSPTPKVGTIFINTDVGTIEYWNGAAWVPASSPIVIPATTVMLFRQAAAPAGWVRVLDAGATDSLIRVMLNGEALADGGSWTISGLTTTLGQHNHDLGLHRHEAPVGSSGGNPQVSDDLGAFPNSGFSRSLIPAVQLGPPGIQPTLTTAPATGNTGNTDLGTPPAVSDGSWRPKHVDVIAATKS